WVWRLGYPTHAGVSQSAPHRTGVTEEQQAQYLVRSHVLLAHAGVELILWHELMDSGWEPDVAGSNFGLWRRDGQAKPAAVAYGTLASRLGGRTYGLPQPSPSLDTDDVTVEALAVVLAALRERLSGSPILLSVAVHPFAGAPGDSLVVVIWVGANPPPAAPVAAISRDELALPRGVRFKVSDWSGAPMSQLVVGPEPVYLEIIPVPVVQSPSGGPDAVMMLECAGRRRPGACRIPQGAGGACEGRAFTLKPGADERVPKQRKGTSGRRAGGTAGVGGRGSVFGRRRFDCAMSRLVRGSGAAASERFVLRGARGPCPHAAAPQGTVCGFLDGSRRETAAR